MRRRSHWTNRSALQQRLTPAVLLRSAIPLLVTAMAWHALEAQDISSPALSLTSPAFANDGGIPVIYTCNGRNASPPLNWGPLPAGAKSLALVMVDPDAPDPAAPKTVWTHWVLYNIPSSATGLPEGITSRDLPAGTGQGTNDWKRTGYGGPCPPVGRHRYIHTLYALDTVFADFGNPTRAALEKAMQGHILGKTQLVGTYEHP